MPELTIKKYPIDTSRHGHEKYTKSQIWIHHTAGGPEPTAVVRDWNSRQPNIRVATAFIIGRDGTIVQCFHDELWANHIGISHPNNFLMQRHSIAIEVCNYGWLKKQSDGSYKNAYGGTMNPSEVVQYPNKFRGFEYYHSYSQQSLDALYQLLCALTTKYSISRTNGVKFAQDFGKLELPTSLTNGIWTHTNVRDDKSDMHPQAELLTLLQNLAAGSCGSIYTLPDYDSLPVAKGGTPQPNTPISPFAPTQLPPTNFSSNLTTTTAPNSSVVMEPSNVPAQPNVLALIQSIGRNIDNQETDQTSLNSWGKRIDPKEESDWIGLKQFLLYLCTKYMPQGVVPFVELIPNYKTNATTGATINVDGVQIANPLDGMVPSSLEATLGAVVGTDFASVLTAGQTLISENQSSINRNNNSNSNRSSFDKTFGQLPQSGFISQQRFGDNEGSINSLIESGMVDLFNLDPFQEAIKSMGVPSVSGEIVKKQRLVGYRVYSQLVLSPKAISGVASKPGAIGFTSLEVKAGSQSDDGLALITMTLVDVQGNKFTDISSPWAFIFNARPGSEAGDFWFRYGWSLRVPPCDAQSLKNNSSSRGFWNHKGWDIFPNDIKVAIMANVKVGIETITLTQKNTIESIFESETISSDGIIAVNRQFVNDNNYTKLSILNPEIESDSDTGALTATINFRTTASVASQCYIDRALATSAIVQQAENTSQTLPLAELLMAIEYDNSVNAALEISDPDLAQKRLQQNQGRIQSYRSGNIQGLVRVIGAYVGGNQGGGIDPFAVLIKIPSAQKKKLHQATFGGVKSGLTIIGWLREVLNVNDCTLLSAASGSGAGINSAYVITTTQDIQANKSLPIYQETQARFNPLSQTTNIGKSNQTLSLSKLITIGEDNDVFAYRHQASLVQSINVNKSNAPNSMVIDANYAFADLPTTEGSRDLKGAGRVTSYQRLRNLYVIYSQMQNVEIGCIAHPWISPGQSIFVKGMGLFDGEYMCLEVTHNLEGQIFTSKLVCARILPANVSDTNSFAHKDNKTFAVANGSTNFASKVSSQFKEQVSRK